MRRALRSTLFPYTTLFRSKMLRSGRRWAALICGAVFLLVAAGVGLRASGWDAPLRAKVVGGRTVVQRVAEIGPAARKRLRSEEHTSELQSQSNLVCRLLLE